MLVKFGVISKDLANIPVQPKPTVMTSKKGGKRKTYEKVRHVAANKRHKPLDEA